MIRFKSTHRHSHMHSNIELDHAEDQVVTINIDKKRYVKKIIPPYANFGREGTSSGKVTGINSALIFADLSKSAAWLFWNLVAVRDYHTNICEFLTSNLTQAEKLKLNRAYKELKEKDLVKRVRNQHYIINPKVILPEFERYTTIQAEWDRL